MTWIRTRELKEINGYLFAVKLYEEERKIVYECLDDESLSAVYFIDEKRYEPLNPWRNE